MKRDMDLVRAILLDIERSQIEPGGCIVYEEGEEGPIPGHSADNCLYNLRLAIDAGLVHSTQDAGEVIVVAGWRGHDFLDQIRDPEIWRVTKEGAKKAGGFSFEMLAALAKGLIKKKIEEHTGIALDI